MHLSRIFKKASSFILKSNQEDSLSDTNNFNYNDGEVIFCKNNVCVHPPAMVRQETDILHHPGYLTVSCQTIDDKRTLVLSWIPNTTLRRHPSTIEQRSVSMTRARCSHSKEENMRRFSTSSVFFPEQRRDSSSSYEAECSGCFPERSLSPFLTQQLQVKLNKNGCFRSSSLSSNSDNNSITPTENVKYDYTSIYCDQDVIAQEDGGCISFVKPSDIDEYDASKIIDEVTTTEKYFIKRPNSIERNDSAENIDIDTVQKFLDFSLDGDLSIPKTTMPSYNLITCNDNKDKSLNGCTLKTVEESQNMLVEEEIGVPSIVTIEQTQLPPKDLEQYVNTEDKSPLNGSHFKGGNDKSEVVTLLELDNVPKRNESIDGLEIPQNENNLHTEKVPKKNIETIDDSNVKAKDNDSTNKYRFKDEQKIIMNKIQGSPKKFVNDQYKITQPDGIIYIDSLVLHHNPHLLNKATSVIEKEHNDFNENKSSINCGSQKRNVNDSCSKDDGKILPLRSRSFEESFGPSWMSSPELLALKHNLTFPESVSASPVVRRTQKCCRKFSVDLSQMRSLRLFFNDSESTKGQLVIASRECQYKILHFHHSGLERLAEILQQWHLLTVVPQSDNLPYRHFMVCKPAVHDDELHPEEGKVGMVTLADWEDMLNPLGQVEDDLALRKGIFLGGLDPCLRKTVWPFLLHCYLYQSTSEEREQISAIRRKEYEQIQSRRLSLEGAAKERFLKKIQYIVEKDVIRTDRANPFFAGESNPNIEKMENILLNYAVYDAGLGYLQGMSDLLAPLLAEIGTEADAFWCFVGLMRRTIFVCTPTDSDMERNLNYLRELIREMVPEFYKHLQRHTDAMELLFCHRWILLCFKREFPEEMALKMWEACWANYLTDYFNLFLCLAIVSAYADDVIAQDLRTDEMLLHFSSLAMFMDGELILRKARGLLYQFRQRPVIPCTLASLCIQCGPGMWDSGHTPTIECRGMEYCKQNSCVYGEIAGSIR